VVFDYKPPDTNRDGVTDAADLELLMNAQGEVVDG